MYWDIGKSLSYNCLFNFIVGARGVGKSYGAKDFAIRNYLRKGEQFVYVRRFEDELKPVLPKFFDDIKDKYSEHEFKVKSKEFKIDDEVAGYGIALTTAKKLKSNPFPNVTLIIFDEFILDKGYQHYIPDEVTNFLELYSTIARTRDVRVYFLSNALSVTNPYFMYFGLTLPYGKNISAKNDILIEMVIADEYAQKAKETRFGKIIEGTQYADYAIDNSFLRDNNDFIAKKTPKSRILFVMRYRETDFGVWFDSEQSIMFISYDVDPNCKERYSMTLADHKPNFALLKGSRRSLFQVLLRYYKNGEVFFESMNIKNTMIELFKLTV